MSGKSRTDEIKERRDGYEHMVADEMAKLLWQDTSISANSHLFEADTWGGLHLQIGLLATALSALTSASIFSQNDSLAIVAGVFSVALLVATAVSTFLNPEQQSATHYKVGTSFRVLANRAERLYMVDVRLRKKDVMNELKKLTDDRDELVDNSPRVSEKYRTKAREEWEARQKKWEEQWDKVAHERTRLDEGRQVQ